MALGLPRAWGSKPTPAKAEHTVPATLLQFELEFDAADCCRGMREQREGHLAAVREHLLHLRNPHTLFESRLLRDVRWCKQSVLQEDGKHDIVVLASKLSNIGYRVHIRTAIGGGSGQDCFHNLHHQFLLISGDGEQAALDFIIDPQFKDQFVIPQPTPTYSLVLQLVPEVFVGTAARLVPLVQAVCKEMTAAFDATGRSCPPWRQAKSMISKWLPSRVRDDNVSGSSDDEEHEKFEVGRSPTGPLSLGSDFSPLSSGPPSPSVESAAAATVFQPKVTTAGFKVKSLLSSGLAASALALKALDANVRIDAWQQPAIRTVKLTGIRPT